MTRLHPYENETESISFGTLTIENRVDRVTVYGNLRNALNRHYEEVFGYPSPRLNFVTGVKWIIARDQ